MNILKATMTALVASSLIASPVVAQAASADRTATSVSGEQLAGVGWGWFIALLVVLGVVLIVVSDSDESPKSP